MTRVIATLRCHDVESFKWFLSTSMELCSEPIEQLQKRILHGAVKVEDEQHHICTIPGHNVFGE